MKDNLRIVFHGDSITEAIKTPPKACYDSGDGVHPNTNGAAFIARHYTEAVKPLIERL